MSDKESYTFTVIRTSDAQRKEIKFSLSKKLGDLKQTLAEEFGVSEHQRLFYMGRELKSGGRSLEKLGLGRSGKNNILHMHIPLTTATTNEAEVSGTKRRRAQAAPNNIISQVPSSHTSSSRPTSGGEGIIEIVDSDDEVSKRRR